MPNAKSAGKDLCPGYPTAYLMQPPSSHSPSISKVPDGVVSLGVSAIRKSVMARANFDIRNVNPLARCPKALQPAVFAHGTLDEIVGLHHGESLFQVARAGQGLSRDDA